MEQEFKRFGLPNLALLTALCQLIGSIGLLFGLINNFVLIFSAGGLSVMMFLACLARLRVKDSMKVSAPALFYFILNIIILIYSFNLL